MTETDALRNSRNPLPFLLGAFLIIFVAAFYFILPRVTSRGIAPLSAEVFHNQDGLMTIPETERPLDFVVIGIDSDNPSFYLLPSITPGPTLPAVDYQKVHEQLYWLNFELCHGRVINAFPPQTKLYVALPDPRRVKGASGNEERYFLDYLASRCGWSLDQIKNRVHFFKSPTPLIWAQDIGKIIGRDGKGRWIIYRGPQDLPLYHQAVADLCAAYPDQFAYRDLPAGVSAEGGDEDLVRTPSGNQVLLLGRHRALKLMNNSLTPSTAPALSQEQLLQDQDEFSKAFDGLPVCLLPSGALLKPSLGNDELFHLDMSTAVVGMAREAQAFVPTYQSNPIDRVTGQPLDGDFVKSLQGEMDLIASELETLGFKVNRLPFGDHPVRSPANMVRFYDPEKGKCEVLLSKYPVQTTEDPNATPAQEVLKEKLGALQLKAGEWQKQPSEGRFKDVLDSIAEVWKEMDQTDKESNPLFDQWVSIFNRAGIDVIPVSDFAWGAGGLHCQVLH